MLGVEGKGTGRAGFLPGHAKSNNIMVKVEGTIDSGASNSVAPIEAAPGVKVRESAGSRRGQHSISAGNERIPNIGEQ
eukprot:1101957-Heterocapsa_arctica.AAC.1